MFKQKLSGTFSALAASVILGSSSLYWKQFSSMPTVVALAWRIVLSLILLAALLAAAGRLKTLRKVTDAKVVAIHGIAGIFIAINWASFIWASTHGHILESALGYLIAPFIVLIYGKIIDKRLPSKAEISVIFVLVGAISVLACTATNFAHWVYIAIGLSWGIYSQLKTATTLDSLTGLFIETICLVVIGGALWQIKTDDVLIRDVMNSFSLPILLAGLISVTPLLFFAYASRQLEKHSLALCQLALPTTQILIAFIFFDRRISFGAFLCVSTIWAAALILKLTQSSHQNRSRKRDNA